MVKRILKEVDKASFQIENSSKDYLEVGLSLKRKKDNETFRLYFGQYTCVDDVLNLNISVFDFWDWVALKNNKPSSHTINKKIETLTVGDRTYNNVWVFKPNAKGFPNALEKDIQTIYWDEVLGLIRYESNSTGVWYLEAVL